MEGIAGAATDRRGGSGGKCYARNGAAPPPLSFRHVRSRKSATPKSGQPCGNQSSANTGRMCRVARCGRRCITPRRFLYWGGAIFLKIPLTRGGIKDNKPSIHPPVYPPTHTPTHLTTYPPTYLPTYLSIYLSIYLPIYLPISLSLYLYLLLFVCCCYVYLCMVLSVCSTSVLLWLSRVGAVELRARCDEGCESVAGGWGRGAAQGSWG